MIDANLLSILYWVGINPEIIFKRYQYYSISGLCYLQYIGLFGTTSTPTMRSV